MLYLVCITINAGHAESYNPPPEYILTPDELAKMEDMDPKDRAYNFIPKGHDCLRRVAGQHTALFTFHLIYSLLILLLHFSSNLFTTYLPHSFLKQFLPSFSPHFPAYLLPFFLSPFPSFYFHIYHAHQSHHIKYQATKTLSRNALRDVWIYIYALAR